MLFLFGVEGVQRDGWKKQCKYTVVTNRSQFQIPLKFEKHFLNPYLTTISAQQNYCNFPDDNWKSADISRALSALIFIHKFFVRYRYRLPSAPLKISYSPLQRLFTWVITYNQSKYSTRYWLRLKRWINKLLQTVSWLVRLIKEGSVLIQNSKFFRRWRQHRNVLSLQRLTLSIEACGL